MIRVPRTILYSAVVVFSAVVGCGFGFPRFGFHGAGHNALHRAALHGDLNKLNGTLRENPSGARVRDAKGNTALHLASLHNRGGAVHLLLAAGLMVNDTNAAGMTPLMLAAEAGSVEVVKMLLKAGANTSMKDARGWTAAKCAKKNHHYEIAAIISMTAVGRHYQP